MSFDEFRQAIRGAAQPPGDLGLPLQALWHDARDDWPRAHACAQQATGRAGAWVHAYLHRKEGDEGNAAYWYARAKRSKPATALEAEWESIARTLLAP
jgi:hypothetical protein